jgi:hypothetical protein
MEKYVEVVLNLNAFLTSSPLQNSGCTSENCYDPLLYHTLTPLSRVLFENLIVAHRVKIFVEPEGSLPLKSLSCVAEIY